MPPTSTGEAASLCSLLSTLERGESVQVELSGIWASGFEISLFFDPDETSCTWDVQPSTWVEVGKEAKIPDRLSRILHENGRARVTVRGELLGPAPLAQDNLLFPPEQAARLRMSGTRYGHLSLFRTKLVIHSVSAFSPPNTEDKAAQVIVDRPTRRGDGELEIPGIPAYPRVAVEAGIQGVVVVSAKSEESGGPEVLATAGDRVLAGAATKALRTWLQGAPPPRGLEMVFYFELERRPAFAGRETRVEIQFPRFARVIAASDDW